MKEKLFLREKIERILERHLEGLTILEISKIVKAHRHTTAKYIRELIGAGIIHERRVSAAKLYYLKGNWKRLRK